MFTVANNLLIRYFDNSHKENKFCDLNRLVLLSSENQTEPINIHREKI